MSLTGTTGKYQNKIKELQKLPLSRYERIFKIFTQGKNGKQFYFYNILNKIEFPDNIDPDLLDTVPDILTAAVATEPSNGTLALAPNGSFVYIPAADFSGTDSFIYTVSDGSLTDTATVNLIIH